MRRTMCVLLAAGAALAPSACGGGDERLTQEEFVEKGNAICTAGSQRIDAAAKEAFGDEEPSKEVITAFVKRKAVPEIEKQLDDLSGLEPPENLETQYHAALKESRRALDQAKANPEDLASDSSDTFAESDELIKAVGLDACVE